METIVSGSGLRFPTKCCRILSELQKGYALRERIHASMQRLDENHRLKRVNLTDEDTYLMKGRQGIVPAYNSQTVVSPLSPDGGQGGGMLRKCAVSRSTYSAMASAKSATALPEPARSR